MRGTCFRLAARAGFATLLFGASPASAQVAPALGAASTFAVLGATTVTSIPTTTITGDLGVSPGTAITGGPVVSGTIHSADAAAAAAQLSAAAAFAALDQTCTLDMTGLDLGGRTLTSGVYCFSSSVGLTGILTLDFQNNPNAVFIFKIGSTITTASNSSVVAINSGSLCTDKVFWRVGSSATLGTGTAFGGNIIALTSVTLTTLTTVKGRVFALNAAVTMDQSTVTTTCAAAPPGCGTIVVSPTTLPGGTTGVAYSQTVTASGGTAPYAFSVTAGALPAGLTLTSAGLLAGTPTTVGTYNFTITATDNLGCLGTRAFTIIIAAPVCPAISLSPATLPGGTVAVAYSQTVVGSGGTAPYSFDLTLGTLPAGLTLTTAGVLAGTPTTAATSPFTIRGRDANLCPATLAYSIIIAAAPPPPPVCPAISLAPATLPSGTVAVAYSQTLVGSGGTAPYSYGVTVGVLPAGLTLTPVGVLAGTPTLAATTIITIRATDANACFAERVFTMIIAAAPPPPPVCPAISLAPTTLPNGTVAVAYSQTLVGSGGTAPYSYGVTVGVLPAGLTLTPVGVLAGTPTLAATTIITIRATDANACFAERAFTMIIAAAPPPPPVCPAISLSPATLPNGTVAVAYSQTLVASGGTAPYGYGVTVGVLPPGITLTPAGVLAGTPTLAATTIITIRATDANGCFLERPFTMIMAAAPTPPPVCPPISLAPATLPNGTVAVAYSQTLVGSGGTAPYSYGVTVGVLPPGIILSSAGGLSGTPTTAGAFTFTIRGTDANACFAERTFTLSHSTAVPALPQVLAGLLALWLARVGYLQLRRRARG